jgi:hypothetical protein
VREGRAQDVYDLPAIRAREQAVARAEGLPVGGHFGPFWNPPFYALPFAPLSAMPFRAALVTWLGINLAALAIATTLLCRMPPRDWRTWGLVPLLVVTSAPFFLALTHGQNTFGSLLLLTLAVRAWRSRHAVLTGVMIGLLAYKPQLAALVGLIALIDLGWKVGGGALLASGALVVTSALIMPGVWATYASALPRVLHTMQVDNVYLWERHVTFKAFWRLLLHGKSAGPMGLAAHVLTVLSAGTVLIALLAAALRRRCTRDRLIAATVAATPLVMPFYFDYDLLLLAVPAVLYAIERPRDAWVLPVWCALYVWLIVNPAVAEQTRVNGAVPLLAALAGLLIARALRAGGETAQCTSDDHDDAAPARATTLAAAA